MFDEYRSLRVHDEQVERLVAASGEFRTDERERLARRRGVECLPDQQPARTVARRWLSGPAVRQRDERPTVVVAEPRPSSLVVSRREYGWRVAPDGWWRGWPGELLVTGRRDREVVVEHLPGEAERAHVRN